MGVPTRSADRGHRGHVTESPVGGTASLQKQPKLKVRPSLILTSLSKATSPKTVNILSSPGGVTIRGGGVPPYNLTYLTPLPLAKSTAGRVRRWLKKDRQAHPNAIEPQGLFPWGSGFVYPFTTNITTAGDALLTIDAGLSVPVRWWWYRIIPWVLKFQVTDSTGNGATGSIAVFINPF